MFSRLTGAWNFSSAITVYPKRGQRTTRLLSTGEGAVTMFETILQDLRYELRTLIKSPRFTSIALITLVLGIAANVAIFTFADAALIRPLPYRDSSELVEIYNTRQAEVFTQFEASYPDFLDWRAQQQVFDGIAGYGGNQVLFSGAGAPELLPSAVATDNFFQTIGVHPLVEIGRA